MIHERRTGPAQHQGFTHIIRMREKHEKDDQGTHDIRMKKNTKKTIKAQIQTQIIKIKITKKISRNTLSPSVSDSKHLPYSPLFG